MSNKDIFDDEDVAKIQGIKDRVDMLADELERIASVYPDGDDKVNATLAIALLRQVDKPLCSFT